MVSVELPPPALGLKLVSGSASNDGSIAGGANGIGVQWYGGSLANDGTTTGGAGAAGLQIFYNPWSYHPPRFNADRPCDRRTSSRRRSPP